MASEMSTREKLLHFGKREFLLKGFQRASLRNIAAAAGLTTGAIYTYFKDKNALFEAIVAPVCAQVDQMFSELSAAYYNASGPVGEITVHNSLAELQRIYRLIYANFAVFRLLVVQAEGSSKADFVHTLVDAEVAHTLAYLEQIGKQRGVGVQLNRMAIHMVSESYINALLEPVRHDMSYEQAVEHLDFLAVFYTGGWKSVFAELLNGKS